MQVSVDSTSVGGSREFLAHRFQALRGISILAVIYLHVAAFEETTGPTLGSVIAEYLSNAARFANPLFFILSGMALALAQPRQKGRSYFRRVINGLVVPFGAYSVIYGVLTFAQSGDAMIAAKRVFSGTAYYHMWFLRVLILLYIGHQFLIRLFDRIPWKSAFVGITFLAGLGTQVIVASNIGQTTGWVHNTLVLVRLLNLLPNLTFFCTGYWLVHHSAAVADRSRRVVVAVLSWSVLAVVPGLLTWRSMAPLWHGGQVVGLSESDPLRFVTSALLGTASLFAFLPVLGSSGKGPPSGVRRLVNTAGLYSLGLYFLHPLVLLLAAKGIEWFLGIGPGRPAFRLLLFAATLSMTLLGVKAIARTRAAAVLG